MKSSFHSALLLVFIFSLFFCSLAETGRKGQGGLASSGPNDTTNLLEEILRSDPAFEKIMRDPAKYELQVIYTQITRDRDNIPHFTQHSFRVNDTEYFNPASFVKLPAILVTLEKMNRLREKNIGPGTRIRFDAAHECQTPLVADSSSPTGFPSIGHLVKKALLASDDEAYNRLYEFCGQQFLNETLRDKGFGKTCILQRFQNCCYDCNRYTNPCAFIADNGSTLFEQPMQVNPARYKNPLGTVLKGKEYMLNNGRMVYQPKDYSLANNLPLQELHDMLLALMFPLQAKACNRFDLSPTDRFFVLRFMAMFPEESDLAVYRNQKKYAFDFKKYFLWEKNNRLRSFNVNAYTYGYMGDCAYIADFENKIEFILVAVLNTNETESIQPRNYQYATLGIPFLKNLGKAIYNHERTRNRTYRPDLTEFEQLTTHR